MRLGDWDVARGRLLAAGLLLMLAGVSPATAFYLDGKHDFESRARIYSEWAVAAEDSQVQTTPARSPFQLIESRQFFNPEFDARLTRYQSLLDDLSFRLALWGFYDGIYEYGTGQYQRALTGLQGRITQGHTDTAPVTRTDQVIDGRKIYQYQPDPVLGSYGEVPFRVNEAYFNFTKGPLFVRLGRQSISWGESDTIGLLDANNPFNLSLAIPGVFQDIDEARIPLWTARATYNLFDSWGPISSAFAEGYLVPGSIDTTVSAVPIPTISPYSPPQNDPQSLIGSLIPPDVQAGLVDSALGGIKIVLYDHLPSRSMGNSRFGFRLGGVINRDYTTSVWYYRTFANPVPRFLPLDLSRAPIVQQGGKGPTQLITELHHGLVDVAGAATTFYSQVLNGIVRTEAELFVGEPAFIPNQNIPFQNELRAPPLRRLLASLGQPVAPGKQGGTVPHANFLRFEVGFDRFFFYRPLNPSNSFTWVTAYVGQWNLSETFTRRNYRFGGQTKVTATGLAPGANTDNLTINTISKLHTVSKDYVDLYPYESFVQSHVETSYLHGRLTPALTAIFGFDGTYVLPVGLTYRYSDSMLFDLKYVALGGNFNFPTGFFRDRSQLAARVTFLLN